MQQAANDLDKDREQRLAAIAEREAAQKAVDDAARERSHKTGGSASFMRGIRQQAGEMSLGEKMRRGGGAGLSKDDD
jgi:hypothetical protein